MTADERLERIAELQRANAEASERIAEHQRQREADPCSEIERMMADDRLTHERGDLIYTTPPDGQGDAPVQKSDAPASLVYKRYENALPPVPEPEPEPSGDDWMDGIAEFTVEYVRQKLAERDARIAKLETQVDMLTRLLAPPKKLWTP